MNPSLRRFLPQGISLYLTYKCQSRCPHCFLVENGKLGRYELSLERCLSIIDEASERHVFLLALSGGEPLLHTGFSRIIEHARKMGLLPLLGLTGVGVTDEHIAQIANQRIPTVQVSLDGATAGSNDKIRGSGSFAEVTDTITRFQRAGIKVNLAICLHQGNAYEVIPMFELALALGIARVKLGFYESYKQANSMSELTEETKQGILMSASEFTLRRKSADWIACPTYDIHNRRNFRWERRSPPLVIGADGELNAGEWGERIGNVSCGTLTDQYSEFVHRKQEDFFDRTMRMFAQRHGVTNISLVDKDFGANAIVYEHDGKQEILVSNKLPMPLLFFTVLHEIGHLATSTLSHNPRGHHSSLLERTVNLWVLDALREHIAQDAIPSYLSAAHQSESALYGLIGERLDKDLVNYWQ